MRGWLLALGVGALGLCGGCGTDADVDATGAASTAASTTGPPTTTVPPTTTTSTTTTSTTTTSTTTTSTTLPPVPALLATNAAFDALAASNPAVTLSVRRDGREVLARASGTTIDGAPATAASPMVVASVSKVITANLIARLHVAGDLDVDAPVPWESIGLAPHPAWGDVTVRELLDHTSGMPVVRSSWFGQPGDCRGHVSPLVAEPPRAHRGRWTYSNGNYCALGLLVETLTGQPLDQAALTTLFGPAGITDGIHLTTDGHRPTDVAHPLGVERLSRLGGAGSFIVSTTNLTVLLAAVTPADRAVMRWPGMMVDQYGWGHTGTIDEAKACVWILESGRTVLAATVAGNRPSTGGEVCDRVVEAVAVDLGLGVGPPLRSPP